MIHIPKGLTDDGVTRDPVEAASTLVVMTTKSGLTKKLNKQ